MDLPLDIKNYLEELLSGYKLSTLKEASFLSLMNILKIISLLQSLMMI